MEEVAEMTKNENTFNADLNKKTDEMRQLMKNLADSVAVNETLEAENKELHSKINSSQKNFQEMSKDINQKNDYEKTKLLQQNETLKKENIRFAEKIDELEQQVDDLKNESKKYITDIESKNKKLLDEASEDCEAYKNKYIGVLEDKKRLEEYKSKEIAIMMRKIGSKDLEIEQLKNLNEELKKTWDEIIPSN